VHHPSRIVLVVIAALAAILPQGSSQAQPAPAANILYLPLVHKVSPSTTPRSPFGLQINALANDEALDLGAAAAPGLARLGDVNWGDIQPTEGGPYQWQALAPLEQIIGRVRARGMEPLVVVQWSPTWARLYPQYECGPIKPEAYDEFAAFLTALADRYSSGPNQVRYWEIWNEPDFTRFEVPPLGGYGCWADPALPYNGGEQFGALMKVAYAGIKAGNLDAVVVSGSVTRNFSGAPYDSFLEGMLRAGATFDQLGFHAYGNWAKEDLVIRKVTFTRALLERYGYSKDTPLLLTEVAALCLENDLCRTIPPSALRNRQARDTARLNAEILALGLSGAIWYTLADKPPGFAQSQLINVVNGQNSINPAYYGLRTSVALLSGAKYSGPQPVELPTPEFDTPQVLSFTKPSSTLHVVWIQAPSKQVLYSLQVPKGATATCTEQVELPTPIVTNCSDTNGDGLIPLRVSESPIFVEAR
jgi:hypothetical protein